MRSLVVSTVVILTLWAGSDLFAQSGKKKIPMISIEKSTISGNVYVVQKGDTLWDICERVFGQKWYWPTLWSYNPHITNPHWIYPGDIVYLKPKGYQGKGTRQEEWLGSRYRESPPKVDMKVRRHTFISPQMLKESGVITHSREEKIMLASYDEVYVKFKHLSAQRYQKKYTLYKILRKVNDPVTKKMLGYHVEVLGTARMIKLHRHVGTLRLDKTYKEIYRGNYVGRFYNHQVQVVSTAAPFNRAARVVAVHRYGFTYYAQHAIVFLNLGRRQGLKRGYRCQLVVRTDPMKDLGKNKKFYPWESFGDIMIVTALENTSMAIVTRSIREIEIGNPCWFRRDF